MSATSIKNWKERLLQELSGNLKRFRPELDRHFLCPTCMNPFQLPNSDNVTEAHIIPQAGGGGIRTLLCRKCNSFFGSKQDKWFGEFIRLASDDQTTIFDTKIKQGSLRINGVPVNGEWRWDETKGFDFFVDTHRNSPETLLQLEKSFNTGKLYPLDSPPSWTVEIETPLLGEKRMVKLGFLTAAYLLWWRVFGYSWVFQKHLDPVRQQILNPYDEVLNDKFFVASGERWDHPWIGFAWIKEQFFLVAGVSSFLVLFSSVDRPDSVSNLPDQLVGTNMECRVIRHPSRMQYGPTTSVTVDESFAIIPDVMFKGVSTDIHYRFVPGDPFEPSDRGDADALDPESDDRVESSSSMLETVVGRALGRRERLSAPDAPVSTPFPGSRSVETVADDVPRTDSSVERTCGFETSAILQFGLALVDERTASLDIGLKL